MLNARKQALENTLRQRLVTIRQNELEYYTSNCRSIGDAAALISGLAYSGIRYHYLVERQQKQLERKILNLHGGISHSLTEWQPYTLPANVVADASRRNARKLRVQQAEERRRRQIRAKAEDTKRAYDVW